MAEEKPSVSRFRKYLQIKTMPPNHDYASAFEFLRNEADEIGLDFQIVASGYEDRHIAIITWQGTKPKLKSILLSSHIDVVPVFPEHWKHDPFSAYKDEQGNIFARGAQDMKCVTIWYLEAIRRLKSEGKTLARTIHLVLTPDEEIGSFATRMFSQSKKFQDLNIAFGLDEGIANPGNKIPVFFGERSIWAVEVTCQGTAGHGSQFVENTAGPKMQYMINKFSEFRNEQEKILRENSQTGLGSVTTVNLSVLKGGQQPNVIPAELTAIYDVRVPPTQNDGAIENMMEQWAAQAGSGVKIDFLYKIHSTEMVKLDDHNKFWMAFKAACKSLNIEIQTEIFPASTDSKFYRKAGVDMLGFSPLNKTPMLLHDHNEYLNENVFLRGIDIYYNVISSLASVEDGTD